MRISLSDANETAFKSKTSSPATIIPGPARYTDSEVELGRELTLAEELRDGRPISPSMTPWLRICGRAVEVGVGE